MVDLARLSLVETDANFASTSVTSLQDIPSERDVDDGPLTPTQSREALELVTSLISAHSTLPASAKGKGVLRPATYEVAEQDSEEMHKLTSWKTPMEHEYRLVPLPFPTMARGIFTEGGDRIVVRGYDKFFAVGEIKWTEVSSNSYFAYALPTDSDNHSGNL